MKLRDLIVNLEKIAQDDPEIEVAFQQVEPASVWFTPIGCDLIDVRREGGADCRCVFTVGPHGLQHSDYKKFADIRDQ